MGGWTFGLLKDLGTAYLGHVAKERLGLDLYALGGAAASGGPAGCNLLPDSNNLSS